MLLPTSPLLPLKNATTDGALMLYAELAPAQIRAAQRKIKAGALRIIAKGVASNLPEPEWPALIAMHRIRVLAALFPDTVLSHRSAFHGGIPKDGVIHLTGSYRRNVELPGLSVMIWRGAPPQASDLPMQGKRLFFPSEARLLLDNLAPSRGSQPKSVGREAVEQRLLTINDARGEAALQRLRDDARQLAPALDAQAEFSLLDALVGSILSSRPSQLTTMQGKALAAGIPYDTARLALFETLAAKLRSQPLPQPPDRANTEPARTHFAFLESYFSNFIEGTEFDVQEARGFVLQGQPISQRPKDSHDILGVFRQAHDPAWAAQVLAHDESVLVQLRTRHADQMRERPEVNPGDFKVQANRAGNTEFVPPHLVRGTLIEGAKMLASVQPGIARALLAMFLVAEIHPFTDGNGRLARLVMNAELSKLSACRIIVPTLFREEYLDCLRVLTRDGEPEPFVNAMQRIHHWSAAFDYSDLDQVIAQMNACHAFERSRVQYKLLWPS
jgi:hypothetical protein